MVARILIALIAVAVAVWMAVDLRAENDYENARELLFANPGERFASGLADEIERAREGLQRSNSVRPGTTGLLLEAFVELKAGDPVEAASLAREATRTEPENVVTWQALLTLSPDTDERARARREVQALDALRDDG